MNDLQQKLLRSLKDVAGLDGPCLGLRIIGYGGHFLRPIPTKRGQLNPQDVAWLTEWRNQYPTSFLTEFSATDNQTAEWLSNKIYFADDRIAFMIENSQGVSVGYMGIAFIDWVASYVEADSIVSGGNNPKGLMASGLITLLRWANGQLGLRNVGVRVLSDNPALIFYQKLGFVETHRVPLRKISRDGYIEWIEDTSLSLSNRYLVYHIWNDVSGS